MKIHADELRTRMTGKIMENRLSYAGSGESAKALNSKYTYGSRGKQ